MDQAEFPYLICADPCLALPLLNDSFTLQTNASGRGVWSVLTISRDGSEHPMAYYSRKLSPAEKNYSVTELEALAVVVSIQHFNMYLHGTSFMVVTDHPALTFLDSAKLLTRRLAGWALLLQTYQFKIVYRPRFKNQLPDALSRNFTETPVFDKDVVPHPNIDT